jgi:hypothetical protein
LAKPSGANGVNWMQILQLSFESLGVNVSVGQTNAQSHIMAKSINIFGEVGNEIFIPK